ncbi:hypothetical protein [Paractinoplanes durhamensis]|uniref:hypothetical protein n=1 Tax=Paractinoplanes durhamensis TaxID=113563 RepID=UPI001943FDAA|nr:hypothetical protein [Actinoplanes durhamensis]
MSLRSPTWPRAAAVVAALIAALTNAAPATAVPPIATAPAPAAQATAQPLAAQPLAAQPLAAQPLAAPSTSPSGGKSASPSSSKSAKPSTSPSTAKPSASRSSAPPIPTVPMPIAAALNASWHTTLVVDLAAVDAADRRTAKVRVDGKAQPADLLPVMSAGMSVALVVDASADGAGTLPAWLSAAARFILEAPAGTASVVIPDRKPAAVLTAPQQGPSGVVSALTTITAGGERDTAAALALARTQFKQTTTGRRLVVMYTSAPAAGDEDADKIAAEFRAEGTLLVVVGTATAGDYWSAAAASTGGFFAPAAEPVVVPALDQVESTLRDRYLVRFLTPDILPATVTVTVGPGAGEITLPRPEVAKSGFPFARTLLIALGVAALVALVIVLIALRRRPRPPTGKPGLTSVFSGRASVPGPARGQARVPWSG